MPAGLQIFDPNSGTLRLDLSDRMFKFLGVAQVGNSYTGTQNSGTIVNGNFNAYAANKPFAFMMGGSIEVDGAACQFSFSGNTLTWSFPKSTGDVNAPWTRPNTVFAYGIW